MKSKVKNPLPTVEYQGRVYKLKSRKINVPDFNLMSELEILIWINKNTIARGYQKDKPLIGGIKLVQ